MGQSSVRTTYAVPGSVPGISLLPMKPSRKPLLRLGVRVRVTARVLATDGAHPEPGPSLYDRPS